MAVKKPSGRVKEIIDDYNHNLCSSITVGGLLQYFPINICRKEMFYLMTHSTHFIYGYMASDIW